MKIRLSELRKIVREEILKEALPPATQDFRQSNLKDGFERLVRAFPVVLTNQVLVQKMNGASMDNRTAQAAAEQARGYVDQVTQQFQQELQALVEKHFVDGVRNFKAPAQAAPVEAPPASGVRTDQRQTIAPPKVA